MVKIIKNSKLKNESTLERFEAFRKEMIRDWALTYDSIQTWHRSLDGDGNIRTTPVIIGRQNRAPKVGNWTTYTNAPSRRKRIAAIRNIVCELNCDITRLKKGHHFCGEIQEYFAQMRSHIPNQNVLELLKTRGKLIAPVFALDALNQARALKLRASGRDGR